MDVSLLTIVAITALIFVFTDSSQRSFESAHTQVRYAESVSRAEQVRDVAAFLLSEPTACTANFTGQSLIVGNKTPVSAVAFVKPNGTLGTPFISSPAPAGRLSVKSIRLEDVTASGPSAYDVSLAVTFGWGQSTLTRKFPMNAQVDASNKLVSCGSLAGGPVNLNGQQCPAGQYVRGVLAYGSLECVTP